MVVHTHQHGRIQVSQPEGKMLVPLWVKVPMDDCTTVLERRTFELDIRITGACTEQREKFHTSILTLEQLFTNNQNTL